MLEEDEEAVICDMAQTYGVMDIYALPLCLFATLACGLPDDSRIKRKLSGSRVGYRDIVLAKISDTLGGLLYTVQAGFGGKPEEPGSLVELLIGKEKDKKTVAFMSYEDFEKERRAIMQQGKEVKNGD